MIWSSEVAGVMEEEAASIQDVEGEQRVESTTGSNNPGDLNVSNLNVSNTVAASSEKELKELAACEQHEIDEEECDGDRNATNIKIRVSSTDEVQVGC